MQKWVTPQSSDDAVSPPDLEFDMKKVQSLMLRVSFFGSQFTCSSRGTLLRIDSRRDSAHVQRQWQWSLVQSTSCTQNADLPQGPDCVARGPSLFGERNSLNAKKVKVFRSDLLQQEMKWYCICAGKNDEVSLKMSVS